MTEPTPALDQWSVERLLRGEPPAVGAAPEAQVLAAMIAAARAAPTPNELAGESAARAAYAERAKSRRRGRRFAGASAISLPSLLIGKAAFAAAAGAVSLGSLAAVAYTGNLPTSWQSIAHHAFGAPAPSGVSPSGVSPSSTASSGSMPAGTASAAPLATPATPPTPTAIPAEPDVVDTNAAVAMCQAYGSARAHGAAPTSSAAFEDLAKAAGGFDKIDLYCASVQRSTSRPSSSPHSASPSPRSSSHSGVRPNQPPSALPSARSSSGQADGGTSPLTGYGATPSLSHPSAVVSPHGH